MKHSPKGFRNVLPWICLLTLSGYAETFKRTIDVDLDRDGKTEQIVFDPENGRSLQIRHGKKLLWQGVPSRWKPWKIEIADVDGDGRREIVVGVFKPTKFFTKPHNCLFVYGFNGQRAFPKWLGSALGRPFTDFAFSVSDGGKGVQLFALETTLEGKRSLGVYRWNGFGFTLERRLGVWQTARILGLMNGQISVEADGKQFFVAEDKSR